jgi:NADPH:quinone reductase-like Zn-dependent oxidoreductase
LASTAAMGGKVFLYGALSSEPTLFPLYPAIGKNLTLYGYAIVHLIASGKLETAKAYITAHLASGAIRPVIAKTFQLAEIADAHRFMETGQQIGKIVVTV